MAVIMATPVDENGNISFSPDEGLSIPITEVDESGNTVDISARSRYINLGGGLLKKSLSANPNNATGRLLELTVQELLVVQSTLYFSLTDEDGSIPIALWEGVISRRSL